MKKLLISIGLSLGTGIAATILSGGMDSYQMMYQPPLSPPAWVFPVVWTILYILMGSAAWIIWESDNPRKSSALRLYAFQLLLNGIWPILFFRFDADLVALLWLVLLWYLVFQTIRSFYEISKNAAYLLIPYLIWLTFAFYLNFAIVLHNWF